MMPAPDVAHLLDQARQLVAPQHVGAPRQTDIRRAISAAYYAAFHATLAVVADQLVGVTARATPGYALVYRSVDHRSLRTLCDDLAKPTIPAKYTPFLPSGGFDGGILEYAVAIADLQERRHSADYDPAERFQRSDAAVAIRAAELAIAKLASAPADQMRTLVLLLAFPPRR